MGHETTSEERGFGREAWQAIVGEGRLPADEIPRLTEAVAGRHRPAVRRRREVPPAALPWPLEPVAWYGLAGLPADTPRPSRTLHYAAGDYYIQDAGSLLALAAAGADRPADDPGSVAGLRICDLCAAPGGKATALVEAVGRNGWVLANEPIRGRLPALAFNLHRTGSDRYAMTSLDPERLADRLPGRFDLVLVDAPCSGQALLGRGRQEISALSPRQISLNAARQRRILAAAVRLAAPGAAIVYSTCTFAADENERQVEWLRDTHGLVSEAVPSLAAYRSDDRLATYRLWPHRDRCAGGFAARLRVPGAEGGDEARTGSRRPAGRIDRGIHELIAALGCEPDGIEWSIEANVCLGWPEDIPADVRRLAVSGPEWFHRTGRTWRPAHALAIRRDAAAAARADLDDSRATAFMGGGSVEIGAGGEPWLRAMWNGRPLGWLKRDRTTGKNHLPPAARLDID